MLPASACTCSESSARTFPETWISSSDALRSTPTSVVVAIRPSCWSLARPVASRSPAARTPARACHHQRRVGPPPGDAPRLPPLTRYAVRGPTRSSAVKRALARHVHTSAVAQVREDLDQPLRVLIRAGARSVSRLELSVVRIRRGDLWLVTGWAQPEMDHLRPHSRVPHERRVKLEREVRTRDDGMDRKDVCARPRTGGLAHDRLRVDRQLEVDRRSCTHEPEGTAFGRRQLSVE